MSFPFISFGRSAALFLEGHDSSHIPQNLVTVSYNSTCCTWINNYMGVQSPLGGCFFVWEMDASTQTQLFFDKDPSHAPILGATAKRLTCGVLSKSTLVRSDKVASNSSDSKPNTSLACHSFGGVHESILLLVVAAAGGGRCHWFGSQGYKDASTTGHWDSESGCCRCLWVS